jgi:hypothetical protein
MAIDPAAAPAFLTADGAELRRMLAEIGRRSTNQALRRADVDRRHPVLLATLAETYVEVLDELVQLLDQALAGADSRARHELSRRLVDRARAETDHARLLDEILDVLVDPNACYASLAMSTGRHSRWILGIGKAWPKLSRDVHDDAAVLVVTAPVDQDQPARRWVLFIT